MPRTAGWRQRERDEGDNHGGPIQTGRLALIMASGEPKRFLSTCSRYSHAHVWEWDGVEAGIINMDPAEYLAEKEEERAEAEEQAVDFRVRATSYEVREARKPGADWNT